MLLRRPHRPRVLRAHARSVALFVAAAAGGCSAPPKAAATGVLASGETLDCPAPIGAIPREDCAEVADDFGALTLSGALQIAGSGREAEARIQAIRAATALANTLKDQRVAACEAYNKCAMTPADHTAKDALLASAMRALIDLWNKRRFSRTDEIARFRDGVRSLDEKVNGSAAKASKPQALRAEDALSPIEGAGLSFKRENGTVTVTAQGTGTRPVLRGRPEAMPLLAGRHYRVRVTGSYAPADSPLIKAGDELVARLKFRATQGGDIYVALRSLEDPEAAESTTTWTVKSGETGARQVPLSADPQATGFYLGVGLREGAVVELDDIELDRGGKVIAAARAEAASEPFVKTDCPTFGDKPLAGAKSLRCQGGSGDRMTIGLPAANLSLTLRVPAGDRAVIRTLSLDGGRSVDATIPAEGEFVIGFTGAGSATFRTVEISEISR